MRKLLLSTAVTATLASVSFAGQAAESATLAVTGTITPAACDVSLSTTALEFGNIPMSTLTENVNNIQSPDAILNVDCNAATATAIQNTDNRAASAMTLAEISEQMKINLAEENGVFGLGTDSAQSKVGAMAIGITSATADGTANSNLLTSTDKASWTVASAPLALKNNSYFALATNANATAPAAHTKSTYTISASILLKKASFYPTGESVPIDGNVTFSVVYL
ncbi:DUF1120 domain-containing protein [Enterobacter cloacae]|uniref:DUF1120 domain-containing protein n=1 Tax=Enterobacter cloacae TaxID=550 RepID=UPI003770563A